MKYKFCPKCGYKLKQKAQNLHICVQCGFNFYQNPLPAAGVILVNQKKQILLIKRAQAPKKNFWQIPGGFMDLNETAEQCACREAEEELGIKIRNLKYLSSHPNRYLYQGTNYQMIDIYFISRINENFRIKPNHELLKYGWFYLRKIDYKKIAFKSNIKAIKDYLKTLK